MERPLGLMCGAGVLPARMASVARRRGWRVVAFTFDDAADGISGHAETVVPSRMAELGAAFERLRSESIADVLFSGRFSMPDVLRVGAPDATFRGFEARARSRSGAAFVDAIIAMLAAHGVRVLDQRDFVGDWLVGPGHC